MKNDEYFEIKLTESERNISKRKEIEGLKKISEKLKNVSKKRIAAGAIATTLALGSANVGLNALESAKKKKDIVKNDYLCLMEVKDSKNLEIYSENGSIEKDTIKFTEKMYVLTSPDVSYDMHNSYLINSDGEMFNCLLKKNDINFKKLYDYVDCCSSILNSSKINLVTPPEGCYIKSDKTLSDDSNVTLVGNGSNVIVSKDSYISTDNNFFWKNSIYVDVDEKKIYGGYMLDGYLIDNEFDLVEGSKYKPYKYLNVRNDSSLSGDVVYTVYNSDFVAEVPNFPAIEFAGDKWLYVAYYDENDKKTKLGYCAEITDYNTTGPVIYLKKVSVLNENSKKVMNFETCTEDLLIPLLVDAGSSFGDELKLRNTPGLNSEITSLISNFSTIYTRQSYLNEVVSSDGHEWLKVCLVDGTEGYVAKEYIEIIERPNSKIK